MIYLDNAATSLIKPARVEQAVLNAMRSMASPGRGGHMPAMRAAETVYECRVEAAKLFNVGKAENIVFTFNATHALNIAIKSLAERGSKVIISGFEHNSVLRPLISVGADIKVVGQKLFDSQSLLRELRNNINTADLVVCTHVSNAFGYILPIYEIAEICKNNSVPLIVDASQSAGILEIDFKKLGAAFIAMPGHKALFAPQGTGILICGENAKALMEGGSGSDSRSLYMPSYLPDQLEAGTHNVPGIAGLMAGISYVIEKGIKNIFEHERRLKDIMCRELENTQIELFSAKNGLQSGVVSVRHRKLGCEELAEKLYDAGICVRSGLHCAPLAHESAGSLDTGTVRFSFSPFVSEMQLDYVCNTLKDI